MHAFCLKLVEITCSVQQIGTSALINIRNHVLGLIWENDSTIYLYDFHSKDENGNLSRSVTALTFDSLYSLENYNQFTTILTD